MSGKATNLTGVNWGYRVDEKHLFTWITSKAAQTKTLFKSPLPFVQSSLFTVLTVRLKLFWRRFRKASVCPNADFRFAVSKARCRWRRSGQAKSNLTETETPQLADVGEDIKIRWILYMSIGWSIVFAYKTNYVHERWLIAHYSNRRRFKMCAHITTSNLTDISDWRLK